MTARNARKKRSLYYKICLQDEYAVTYFCTHKEIA